jgi:Domain of unknown function (DUF4116)
MPDIRPRLKKIMDLHGQALLVTVCKREATLLESLLSEQDLIHQFADIDPTHGKSRTQWLVQTYIKDDQFKLEDLGRAHAALSAFERFKPKLSIKQRELSQLTRFRDLEALVDPFVKAEAKARLERDLSSATGRELRRLEELKARDESIILQEEEGLPTIVVPMTEFAACWWGRGTKWCTSAEKDNKFYFYHQDAPLIIIIFPNGNKLQAYANKHSVQFMDATDIKVGEETLLMKWDELKSLIYWMVVRNGFALQFVPIDSRTPELCRLAIEQNALALKYVPSDLKLNRGEEGSLNFWQKVVGWWKNGGSHRTSELCRLAVQKDGRALEYVPIKYRDRELCHSAIQQHGDALRYVPDKYTSELYNLAIEQNGWTLRYMPDKYRTYELYRLAIQKDGLSLQFVPEKYINHELYCLAVKQTGWALEYVPDEHKTLELCRLAVLKDGWTLVYVPERYRTLEICRLAVEQNGEALYYVPNEYRTPEFCSFVIRQNGMALKCILEDKRTWELCCLAVQQNGVALKFVPEKYKVPELLALVLPMQPKWHPYILQGLLVTKRQ